MHEIPLWTLSSSKANTCFWWNAKGKLGLKLLFPLPSGVYDPCKDSSCRGQLGLPSQASQVLLGHSFSLDSVLLYLRVQGLREEESLCFYHQDPRITASGLTICGGFFPGSWQVGILGATFWKAKVMSALRTAQKRISPCYHHWIPAALSSQTCESSLSSLTEFCPSLLMGQGRQTLMELTDVARPPQQQPGQRSTGLFPVTGGPWPLFLKRAWIKRHSG